jgi:hypothetical protein
MDNINMKIIKYLKDNKIELDGVIYKGYTICNLPPSFGCINFNSSIGISEWFKHKGLTYIIE